MFPFTIDSVRSLALKGKWYLRNSPSKAQSRCFLSWQGKEFFNYLVELKHVTYSELECFSADWIKLSKLPWRRTPLRKSHQRRYCSPVTCSIQSTTLPPFFS